jgi:hypothetical protein
MNALKLMTVAALRGSRVALARLRNTVLGSARPTRTTPVPNTRARLDLTAFECRCTPAALTTTVLVETHQPALVRVVETDATSSFTGIKVNDRVTAITTGQQDDTPMAPSGPHHKINRAAGDHARGNAIDDLKVTAPVTRDEVGNGPTKQEVLNDATQKNVPADILAEANTPPAPAVNHDVKHLNNPKPPTVHVVDSFKDTAQSDSAPPSKIQSTDHQAKSSATESNSKQGAAESTAGSGGDTGAQPKQTSPRTGTVPSDSAAPSKVQSTDHQAKPGADETKVKSASSEEPSAQKHTAQSKATATGHGVSSDSAAKAANKFDRAAGA